MVCNVFAAVFSDDTETHAHNKGKYYPIDEAIDNIPYNDVYCLL